MAGAAIGTMIAPGVGTLVGGAIGAVVGGLALGTVAGEIAEATKDWAVDLGQDVANTAEDVVGAVDDGLQAAEDFVDDIVPDIDVTPW